MPAPISMPPPTTTKAYLNAYGALPWATMGRPVGAGTSHGAPRLADAGVAHECYPIFPAI
jgi:hypothetical protein